MDAQLWLSSNYQNFGDDYEALGDGNMTVTNGAEDKILSVGTKFIADELDNRGTIHIPDESASLEALDHVLSMKKEAYLKIQYFKVQKDQQGKCYLDCFIKSVNIYRCLARSKDFRYRIACC